MARKFGRVNFLTNSKSVLEVLEADGSNVWHVWVWRRRRATLNGWIFQARVCPFGWPWCLWCPWCPGQMNERGCEPSVFRVHSYWCTLDSTLDVPKSDEMDNTETDDIGLSFLLSFQKLKKYEELTYAHGLCLLLTWFAFHFFEQKNRVKLTGCVAQEWEDSSLRDTKVWAPYYGRLLWETTLPAACLSVILGNGCGQSRSKGSDLPILSIKFVFATRHTQKLCKNTTLFFERDFIERK